VLNLAVGDVVVYAWHGIGYVEARAKREGEAPEAVVVVFESGLRVTLPIARAQGALRAPSSEVELDGVRRTLGADSVPHTVPWSRRFRTIQEKVNAGEVTGLAEVVRDGLQRERRRATSAGGRGTTASTERGLYLQARKLLAAEIAFARGIDPLQADVWIVEQIDEESQS
jgi:RNA polymerase-interacting CarD/CdnL/TRCF family regulator